MFPWLLYFILEIMVGGRGGETKVVGVGVRERERQGQNENENVKLAPHST